MFFFQTYLKKLKRAFIEEFSSVRLAVVLFAALGITTLIGTILPEEPILGRVELIKKYGLEKYNLLKSLGLTDVFHSWWYLALFTTLGLNLIIASIRRVFPKCTRAFAWPVKLNEENIKKLPINCEFELNNGFSLELFQKKLKQKKYRTKVQDGNLLLAVRGGWHRLGASVTHVGILVLLLGALISTITGFNGMVQLQENEGFYITDLGQSTSQVRSSELNNWLAPISKMPIWFGMVPPYLVKVNKTWRENYDSGQPKQWYSDISVYDQNENELVKKTIFVNNPLEFMGLDIYQSNWGRFLLVSFNNQEATFPLENFNGEDVVFLPLSNDVGLKLKANRDLKMTSRNNIKNGLEIYSVSPLKQKYLGTVKKGDKIQIGPIKIGYFGTETLTGLQFKSNPGDFLIYPGLVFIILGVIIAFGSREQVWAMINPDSNKIIVGGKSDRSRGKFFEEFEKLITELLPVGELKSYGNV